MTKQFTPDELADRWYDRREIVNLAGKFVTSILLKQEDSIFDRFWSQGDDACLSFNDGSYQGSAAVREYFAVTAENTDSPVSFTRCATSSRIFSRLWASKAKADSSSPASAPS